MTKADTEGDQEVVDEMFMILLCIKVLLQVQPSSTLFWIKYGS